MVRVAVAALACLILSLCPARAIAHPLHTTLAELEHRSGEGSIVATIRVFADDFGTAVAKLTGTRRAADHSVPPGAAFAYVARRFWLTGPDGRRLPLSACGQRRAGEVLFVCVRAPARRGLRGMSVASTLMFDLFTDQVNIVQVASGGKKRTLLFTPGDRPKPVQ